MSTPAQPKLIDTLELPAGLRNLDVAALTQVADELRDELIDTVSSSGGHFASSLGTTEISVALHHLFDTPHDRLVWDVGHQAYVHKMLTGRRKLMGSIRQKGGLSGFLKRNESDYDSFGAGHAGTSISAAVGMSVALERTDPRRYVVAIIGDASIGAGMAFEALNNAGALGLKNFIVILNDNEMSISENVGFLSSLFSWAVTSKASTKARSGFKELYKKGYVPKILYRALDRAEEAAQGFFATPAMLFESFGFRYIGPIDGHNMNDLVVALSNAKQQDVPVIIHARTQKGKGYQPAESDPITWHGVTPFDRQKGEFNAAMSPPPKKLPSFTGVFADTMIEIAKKDPKVIAITAAMPGGTGLDKFQTALPEQFYDVGICEQHAVTFAAGLACEGFKPVCAIYSTFLQRAYDQVVHDVCIQNLPVLFAMDRSGLVGNDGETHQGVFDISYMRTLPHMTIMSPRDEGELRHMIYTALMHPGPIALRYPRGNGFGLVSLNEPLREVPIGKAEVVVRGEDALLIAFGPTVHTACTVAERLLKEKGISSTVINARFAKPLDEKLFMEELPNYSLVCTIEDHALQGGFGGALLEFINDNNIMLRGALKRFGVGDSFIAHASQAEQQAENCFDAQSIFDYAAAALDSKKVVAFG